jgi:hypothetical protein
LRRFVRQITLKEKPFQVVNGRVLGVLRRCSKTSGGKYDAAAWLQTRSA